MGSLFGSKTPAVPPPPPAPTMDNSAAEIAAAQEAQRRRAVSGRASTVLTGGLGTTDPETATKTLLGA